ncbi:hypothetical protein [Methanosarcina sp. WWM596]|uniref:hypothetical protein n=1 Tax=Methanosarcina sp. WWM596 TaxID=1434103 RepID=UPI0006159BCE|nr:hypothetical protein [Methanosarcina sp. WWM596]AKB18666.1 hypothetical protein MSWHS_1803 [Methanosarcina sp. WWM596]
MDGSDIKSIVTLSNPNFYKKVIQKYQTGKRNASKFPRMIFHKEKEYFVPPKINMILKFRLHLDKQNIVPSFLVKNVTESSKVIKPLFLAVNATSYQQVTHATSSDIEMVNSQPLSYGGNTQSSKLKILGRKINNRSLNIAKYSTFTDKENKLRYQSVLEHKSPAISLNKQNVVSSVIVKNIPVIREMFSGLNTEKNILQPIVKSKSTPNINDVTNVFLTELKIPGVHRAVSGLIPAEQISANRISVVSFLKSIVFRTGNIKNKSNKTLNPLFLGLDAALYQQTPKSIYHDSVAVNHQILNYGNNSNIFSHRFFGERINYRSLKVVRISTVINEENSLKNRSVFEHKSPVILLQDNLLFNTIHGVNRLFFNELNQVTVNKPFINNYYGSSEQDSSGSVQNTYACKAGIVGLHFQEPRSLEQEIKQIKEIVLETKKSVSQKTTSSPGEADIKRHLDINRISDQVYQNIERTIRMERERRGF